MNKDNLWIVGVIVTILGTLWCLAFVNSIIPDVPAPEGVDHWQSTPWYGSAVLISILFAGIIIFLLLVCEVQYRKIIAAGGLTVMGYIWLGAIVNHIIPVLEYGFWCNTRPWYFIPIFGTIILFFIVTFILLIIKVPQELPQEKKQ